MLSDLDWFSLAASIRCPDFPTGAEVYGGAPMHQAYETGRGSVTIRAVATIEERKNGRYSIVITEVPYGMSKENFVDKVRELVLAKKITHIADARDESARSKVRVVVELKKDAYPKKILNQLYKLTGLQTSFHYNVLALVNGIQPRVMGLKEILAEFIKHRQGVIRRRTEFELRKASISLFKYSQASAPVLKIFTLYLFSIRFFSTILKSAIS